MATEGGVRGKSTMTTSGLVMFSVMMMMSGVSGWGTYYKAPFSYGNQDVWGGDCHVPGKQSPLNFQEVCPDTYYPAIQLRNYNKIFRTTTEVLPNKYSVKVKLHFEDGSRPYIEGSNLEGKYFLDSFHFHWGASNGKGSEHRLLGCSFAGEIHLVHIHETHKSFADAVQKNDGLAVLGVWMKPAANNSGANPWFNNLLPGGSGDIYLRDILPSNVGSFYRYTGSKTTPPCSLDVVWSVFRDPVLVPKTFFTWLRSIDLHPNYRNIQDQGGRVVIFRDTIDRHFAPCDDDGGNDKSNRNDNGNDNGTDNDDNCNCIGHKKDFCNQLDS